MPRDATAPLPYPTVAGFCRHRKVAGAAVVLSGLVGEGEAAWRAATDGTGARVQVPERFDDGVRAALAAAGLKIAKG